MSSASRSLGLAFVAALLLAACGGGGKSAVPSQPNTASGHARKVMSVPCTPDSYGYCDTSSRHVQFIRCNQFTTYETGYIVYEVYNSTTDLGQYTITYNGTCDDPTNYDWYPSDPATTYGDPNLP